MKITTENSLINLVADAIEQQGYAIIDNALADGLTEQLFQQLKLSDPDKFKLAGIGRESDFQTNKQIRNDKIKWLDQSNTAYQAYFKWAESLRMQLNQQCYLGLFEYECMFAHYPAGAFYQKHVDAFRNGSNRKISTVLYLNHNWHPGDGGELVLYKNDSDQVLMKIEPTFNKLVVFLSEDFPHEVLPAKKSRFSLTGWFRIKELIW